MAKPTTRQELKDYSLNLGASASLVPLNTIFIWNPVNSVKLSAVN